MTFSHPKNNAIKKSIFGNTSRFVPTNDCVLFVLVKVAFLALHSGIVRVDGSSPIFIFGAVNKKLSNNFVAV